MGRYFKPLRRKIGVITLVMACTFAAGWIRSLSLVDYAGWDCSFTGYDLKSERGQLWFFYTTRTERRNWAYLLDSERISPRINTARLPFLQSNLDWRWDWLGFHFSSEVSPTVQHRYFIVPYWFIVVPLTVLSAWLILSKPRTKSEPSITPANEST
jgi:hypothetical protein